MDESLNCHIYQTSTTGFFILLKSEDPISEGQESALRLDCCEASLSAGDPKHCSRSSDGDEWRSVIHRSLPSVGFFLIVDQSSNGLTDIQNLYHSSMFFKYSTWYFVWWITIFFLNFPNWDVDPTSPRSIMYCM